jgi:hypothetical protein
MKAENKQNSDIQSIRSAKSSATIKSAQSEKSKNQEEGKSCINGFYNIIQFTKSLFTRKKEEEKK